MAHGDREVHWGLGGRQAGAGQQRDCRGCGLKVRPVSARGGHEAEGGVGAGAEAGGQRHGRAEGLGLETPGPGAVGGVGQAVRADLLILPPLGASVLEPDLDPGLRQPDLHGELLPANVRVSIL